MKRTKIVNQLCLIVLFMAVLVALTGCAGGDRNQQVVVFNFGEYLDPKVITMFEEETGYKVLYDEFQTNEAMYAKLTAEAADYDLVCASDYMVEKLRREERLLPIDFAKVPASENIGDDFWAYSRAFDPDLQYSIPHFYGVVGLLYNKQMVDESKVDSWQILWDEEYAGQIIMPNSMRDSFLIPLLLLGYSINTTDQEELLAAQAMLIEQKPLVQAYLVDEARDEMVAENAALAAIYSSEAYAAFAANGDLGYALPKEGSNLWIDSWVIPCTCQNKEGAEALLDFLCREDIAMMNFEYIYFATPNQAVYDALPPSLQNDRAIFPTAEDMANCEVFVDLGDDVYDFYSKLWKEIKAE